MKIIHSFCCFLHGSFCSFVSPDCELIKSILITGEENVVFTLQVKPGSDMKHIAEKKPFSYN